MTWLSKLFGRKKIEKNGVVAKSKVPSGLWTTYENCKESILLEAMTLSVCPQCNFHHRMNILDRINNILDPGFSYLQVPLPPDDPIHFLGPKPYSAKLKQSREGCAFQEAFAIVSGTIESMPIVSMFMDFDFIGGSMGIAVGDAIAKTCETGIESKVPVIIFSSSGGARMQEGIYSLMQMPRSVIYVESVKRAGLPFISVLTHPTTGGVLASFAMRGSVILSEPDAVVAFTGPRVIKETLGVDLPPGFQSAQSVYSRGFIDQIVQRSMLREKIAQLLRIHNAT